MRKPRKYKKIIAAARKLFNWWKFAGGILQLVLFMVLWSKWSLKKRCGWKVSLAISEKFLHEKTANSYRFKCKFAFNLFLFFELSFQQVCGLETRNISVFLFITSCALLQSHADFNKFSWKNFFTRYSWSYYSSMNV